jgi:type IV secretion system protein VirB5
MKRRILAGITCLLCVSSLHADLIGVADAALYSNAVQQLETLQQQYKAMSNHLKQLKDLNKTNTGHYGYGELSNGLNELQSWQSPVSSWEDALRNLSGGNTQRYQSLVQAYEQNHPQLAEPNFTNDMSQATSERFKEDKAVNRAVLVQTTDAYNEINKHLAQLQTLSKAIEKTANTKGAIDLNSRLVTELGFIQLMQVRLQTLSNQQLAQDSLDNLSERAKAAHFNRKN